MSACTSPSRVRPAGGDEDVAFVGVALELAGHSPAHDDRRRSGAASWSRSTPREMPSGFRRFYEEDFSGSRESTLAGNGLNPVASLHPPRLCRAEVRGSWRSAASTQIRDTASWCRLLSLALSGRTPIDFVFRVISQRQVHATLRARRRAGFFRRSCSESTPSEHMNRVQRRLIRLSLSWADAVSHDCTAHAQRFLHSLSRISRSLVLHLGVELGSDQDDDDRKPNPDHEADSGTQ